jgi:hypothetical protein
LKNKLLRRFRAIGCAEERGASFAIDAFHFVLHILEIKLKEISHPLPYAALSIGAFIGNSLLGVRQGCLTLSKGQGSPFRQPPVNARSAGSKRHRSDFFWLLFFVRTKKIISSVGTRTHIRNNCRVSDTFLSSWFDKLTTNGLFNLSQTITQNK